MQLSGRRVAITKKQKDIKEQLNAPKKYVHIFINSMYLSYTTVYSKSQKVKVLWLCICDYAIVP